MQNRASGGFAVSHLPQISSPDIIDLEPDDSGKVPQSCG
jgi:hypothetical protein